MVFGCQTTMVSSRPVSGVKIDKGTAINIQCLTYEAKMLENRLLQGQAQVKNCSLSLRQVRYKAEWYSAAGALLGGSHWESRFIQPGETVFIAVIAHDAMAESIQMYLK